MAAGYRCELEEAMHEFPTAPMSRAMKLGSAFVVVVSAFVAAALPLLPPVRGEGISPWVSVGLGAFLVGAFGCATDTAPASFRVDGKDLVVRGRLGRDRRFAIVGAATPLGGKLRGVRIFGASGYLGYHGRFVIRGVGKCRVFASRADGIVVVPTASGPVLVTPADIAGFVAAVAAAAAA